MFFLYADEEEKIILEKIVLLGNDDFEIREKATKYLLNISVKYKPLIQKQKSENKDLEVEERLNVILKELEKKEKLSAEELLEKVSILMSQRRHKEALEKINEILFIYPTYTNAITIKYQLLEILGDYKGLIELLKSDLEKNSDKEDEKETLSIRLAQLYLRSNNYAEAVQILEKILNTTRYTENIKSFLITAYEYNNQEKKAEELLQDQLSQNPTNRYAIDNLAWFYIRNGNLKKAQETLAKNSDVTLNDFQVNDVLNFLFLNEEKLGAEKLTKQYNGFLSDIENLKELTVNQTPSLDVLYMCYLFYFNHKLGVDRKIDFKKIYSLIKLEEKKEWPIPLLGLYAGEITPEKVFEQAKIAENVLIAKMNMCEAYFYTGLYFLTKNNKNEAKKYFQLSKEQKIYDYVETTASNYFLNTIDMEQPKK